MNSDSDFLIANSSNIQNDFRSYESLENRGRNREPENAKRTPQYLAAIAATLSALSAGIVLGWTSPIEADAEVQINNITVNTVEMGWIGSLVNVGAFLTCIPAGFLCDLVGRRNTLLLLMLPYTMGWVFIILARNLLTLYFGRFILGMAVGATCVVAPLYTSEIAHKKIRGALGSYFQLMITIGVLYSYTFGAFLNLLNYTYVCSIVPIAFVILFSYQPETPLYYLKTGEFDKAKAALSYLRGKDTNVDAELNEIEETLKESQSSIGFFRAMQRKSSKKAVLISLTLMLFQQLSGINAIVFYTSTIFKDSGVSMEPKYATIIIGSTQVVATFISSLVVDKLGRKFLLSISAAVISVSITLLGLFFLLKTEHILSEDTIQSLAFLPIVFLVIYIIAFSIGFGPIPWMISGEIYSPEIKSVASSIAGSFNWFLAFLITKYYFSVSSAIGEDYTFFAFGILMLFVQPFIYYVVPETKGKTIAEIQMELQR